MENTTSFLYSSDIKVQFPGNREATMVLKAIEVDEELQPTRIMKILSVQENFLTMYDFILLFNFKQLFFI
jgi:hypothetical protein